MRSTLLSVAALLSAGLISWAAPASAQLPAMRDRPLSAAERTRLQSLESDIQRISRARNTSAAAVRAIAGKLGARLTTDDPKQILDLIDRKTADLVEARVEIGRLEQQLETLDSMRLARAVQPLLEAATTAIDAGELDIAEQKLAEAADRFGSARRNLEGQVEDLAGREAEVVAQRAAVRSAAFDYRGAADLYAQAFATAPAGRPLLRWGYSFDQAVELHRLGLDFADLDALKESEALLREQSLPLAPRDQQPLEWSETQARRGGVLASIGERTRDRAVLDEAITALRSASEALPADAPEPVRSGLALNLGGALANLGEQSGDTALIRESIAVMSEAAGQAGPAHRASLLGSVAASQGRLALGGDPEISLPAVAAAFGEAAAALSAADQAGERGLMLMQQAFILQLMAQAAPSVEGWRAAETVANQGLAAATRDVDAHTWAKIHRLQATILLQLAQHHPEASAEALASTFSHLDQAAEVYTIDDTPGDWAALQQTLGAAHGVRADQARDPDAYRAAIDALEASNRVATLEAAPRWRAENLANMGEYLAKIARIENDPGGLTRAMEALRDGAAAARVAGDDALAAQIEAMAADAS